MNQMFSILGALVLLGFVTLSINSMLADKTTTMLDAEASMNAISIAQTMLDEVFTKSFDAATANGTRIYDSTLFTSLNNLGPSGTERDHVGSVDSVDASAIYYNDVDDYNGYTRIASTPVLGKFTVRDTVYYVQESNPDQGATAQTNFKKIVVTVTHANMTYPLKISDIAVYRKYF